MKVEIFDRARALGHEIACSEEYRRLQRAQMAYDADLQMKSDLKRVEELNEEIDVGTDEFIALKQLEGLKTEVAELKAKIASSKALQELREANTSFTRLMEEVNQVIGFVINGEAADANHAGRSDTQGYQQVH